MRRAALPPGAYYNVNLSVFFAGVSVAIPQTKYVILSASEISHRTIDLLNKLSLRGKRSDEANSREGGSLRSICSALYSKGLPRLPLAKALFIPYRRHCRHFPRRRKQKNTSFCQCRVSKLACKGLRAKIFIKAQAFYKNAKR